MPKVTVLIPNIEVDLDVPADFAAYVTLEDLREMAEGILSVRHTGIGIDTVCAIRRGENAPPRTLSDIGRTAHEINARNGWDTFTMGLFPASPEPGLIGETNENQKVRFLCTHMALVHTEVSEATEAIRHRDRENFDEELADIIIRVTSIAHGLGTDLEAAVAAKLEKNKSRGFKHGGKAI